jgi:hypothetical protein
VIGLPAGAVVGLTLVRVLWLAGGSAGWRPSAAHMTCGTQNCPRCFRKITR